ncbi:MAG: hypothetical protein AAGB14_12465 [Verrucomicrobiota bacterium]
MRTLLLLASCATAIGGSPMAARFDNGDTIKGSLVGFEEDAVIWKSDFFVADQALKLDRLVDVSLPASSIQSLPDGDHIAVATLTNGDVVRGSLLNLNDKEVGLKTSFAGDLIFRRDMVAALDINDKPDIIYSGPRALDEWTMEDEDDWTFEDGVLTSNSSSSIARDMGRHDRFHLSFDVEWRGSARFRVFTNADNLDFDEIGNSFELVCQSQYAYMRKRTKRNGRTESVTIGTTGGVREFQEREKVRVELLHDNVTGRIRFILGGRVVADWREPAPGVARMGGVVHFLSDSGKRVRISRIRMTTWDGMIEGEWQDAANIDPFGNGPEEDEEPETEDTTGIKLRNGDLIEGETLGIEEGNVKVKTTLGEFMLPVSRLRTFALRTPEEAADPELTWKPIRRRGDVRAHFTEGGSITFELTGFGEDSIRGRSQTFGEAEFDLAAFNRLEFNIYSSRFDDEL